MSVLMRASEIIGRPVVTLSGVDVAQVKDVVYDGTSGNIGGFTLNGRGHFAGPLRQALAWEAVHACGPDAVMIGDEGAFSDRDTLVGRAEPREAGVLGLQVLSYGGVVLGQVVDVIVQIALVADVVGYEIETGASPRTYQRRVLIPLPDTLAVSGRALIVPEAAIEFLCEDLASFGAAVDTFRARLRAGAL